MKITTEIIDCMTELYKIFSLQSPSFSSRQKWSDELDKFQKVLEDTPYVILKAQPATGKKECGCGCVCAEHLDMFNAPDLEVSINPPSAQEEENAQERTE